MLPALSSFSGIFSIGNILILVENKDFEVELSLGDGIHSTGYAYHISKKKKKSYFCLFGIWFSPEIIDEIIGNKLSEYRARKEDFDEIRLGIISYPMIYINRFTGALRTCSCFDGLFDIECDIVRVLPYGNSEEGLRNRVREIKVTDGLCHLCNGGIPRQTYGHAMYYSSFLQRYLPYHRLLSRKKHGRDSYEKEESREIENELRERFEYPKIGEKWKSEIELLNIIKSLFPEEKIIHQANFEWLELQRIDIYIPRFKVGIEYHGLQHYKPVEFFGGTEGFQKTKERDWRKAKLCQDNGVRLIYFSHNEAINEKRVESKILRAVEVGNY